jgi:hypothetical protein
MTPPKAPRKSSAAEKKNTAARKYTEDNRSTSSQNRARIADAKQYGNKKAKSSPTKGGGRTRAI